MYKISESVDVELNKVTPKALKGLKELGLYDIQLSNEEVMKVILDIFTESEKLVKLLNIIFKDVPVFDYEEADLSEVFGGYQSFLFSLIGK